ncbi:MAG: hypothetical protein K2K79_06915 [Paramuribaculum sp.]|nr:hypothetical protein [Paramuribaculum sp.]
MKEVLGKRIGLRDINHMRYMAADDNIRASLFALINDPDDRVGYNALWIFTHFNSEELRWLIPRRNYLIDYLLAANHIGKQRLILTLLDRMPTAKDDLRTDYLDFCLSRINSTLPYGIRALCLKQAFAQCRHYSELMQELRWEIEMMDRNELSPGVASARRQVLRKIARIEVRCTKTDNR